MTTTPTTTKGTDQIRKSSSEHGNNNDCDGDDDDDDGNTVKGNHKSLTSSITMAESGRHENQQGGLNGMASEPNEHGHLDGEDTPLLLLLLLLLLPPESQKLSPDGRKQLDIGVGDGDESAGRGKGRGKGNGQGKRNAMTRVDDGYGTVKVDGEVDTRGATGLATDDVDSDDGRGDGSENEGFDGVSGGISSRSRSSSKERREEEGLSRTRGVCVALSMWMLMFLQAANLSGMTMVQSSISADLAAWDSALWFTSSFFIANAASAPLFSRLATIFHPPSLVLIASTLFSLGSALAAWAPGGVSGFIAGRVLTGCGAGGVMILSLILVLGLSSKRRRGLFVGLVNAGFTVGVSLGAVLFGALVGVVGWRWLFGLQAPLGMAAGLAVWLSLPGNGGTNSSSGGKGKHRGEGSDGKRQVERNGLLQNGYTVLLEKPRSVWQRLRGIDYAGALTLTSALVLFLYGLSGTIEPLSMVLSLIPLALFLLIESRYATDPIIPIKVLSSRGVLLSCLAQLGFMASRWTVLFYAPIFALAVRGLPPAVAGSVLIPTNTGFGIGSLLVGWLHIKRGGSFWLACLVSMFLSGVTLLGLGLVSHKETKAWVYVFVLFCNGFTTGATLNYTLAHVLHLAGPEMHYIATGMLATVRGFAASFGTTIGGGAFTRTLKDELAKGFAQLDDTLPLQQRTRDEMIRMLVGSPALVYGSGHGGRDAEPFLTVAERRVAVGGYEVALRRLYLGAVVLTACVLLIQAATGWSAPSDVPLVGPEEEAEEVEDELGEHDGRMEA